MSTKKSWFGYAIWGIFTVVLCLYFSIFINTVCQSQNFTKNGTILTVCLGFLGIPAFFFLLCFLWEHYGRKHLHVTEDTKKLWEIFLALSLFAGALLCRVYWFFRRFIMPLGSLQYFEAAIIQESTKAAPMRHGAACLYTGLLSLIFSFLGNKQFAALVLQTVLQIIGMVLFYFAVRRLTGKKAALVSFAILAFFPSMVRGCFAMTPEILYFFLFSCLLFLLSLFRNGEEKKGHKTASAIFITAFLGLCSGYLLYLDGMGVLFLTALLFVLLSKKRKKGKTPLYIMTAAASAFAGFGLLLLWEAVSFDSSFFTVLLDWWKLCFGTAGLYFKLAPPDISPIASLIGCFLAAWHILSFPFLKRDNGSFYMFSILIISVSVFFTNPYMDYQLLGTMLWSVLAGLGVSDVFQEKSSSIWFKKEAKTEKTIVGRSNEIKMSESDITIEEITEEAEPDKAEGEKPVIQFIENPLPLPKKHVKKTMDYMFQPEEALMKYDIYIDENDDFDLP